MRTLFALVTALVLASRAVAQTPLPDPDEMAERSARVLGAAAACGVSASRIATVRRAVFELLGYVAFDKAEARRAERHYRQAETSAAASMRDRPGECPAAITAFERAERN